MRLKYLMLTHRGTRLKVPVLFPEYLHHRDLAPSPDYQVTSAGFATVTQATSGVSVEVDGKSTSLHLQSSHQDAKIIVDWLELGLAGALGEQEGFEIRATMAQDAAAHRAATRSRYPMEHRPVAGRRAFFDRLVSDTCRAVGVDVRRVISAEESMGEAVRYPGGKIDQILHPLATAKGPMVDAATARIRGVEK